MASGEGKDPKFDPKQRTFYYWAFLRSRHRGGRLTMPNTAAFGSPQGSALHPGARLHIANLVFAFEWRETGQCHHRRVPSVAREWRSRASGHVLDEGGGSASGTCRRISTRGTGRNRLRGSGEGTAAFHGLCPKAVIPLTARCGHCTCPDWRSDLVRSALARSRDVRSVTRSRRPKEVAGRDTAAEPRVRQAELARAAATVLRASQHVGERLRVAARTTTSSCRHRPMLQSGPCRVRSSALRIPTGRIRGMSKRGGFCL
jgi:hypothetical protein